MAFEFHYVFAGWYYTDFEILSYCATIDTIITGNEYYQLNNNSIWGENSRYMYNVEDNMIYIRYQDSDYVFMDFNLNNGEEFLHMNTNNAFINATIEEGQINLLDSVITYKGFSENYYQYLFAEGIGLIKRSFATATYDIIQSVLYDSSGYRVIKDKTLPKAQLDSNYTLHDINSFFTTPINHKFSVKSKNEPGVTIYGDTYIDSVRIEVCYQNSDTTIILGEQSMAPLDEITFGKFLTLAPNLIYSHYDLCYRIWAKDRGLIPREVYTPVTGKARIIFRTSFTDYYPLHRFNRWVYNSYILYPNGDSSYTGTVGHWIGKDTILTDNNIYKPIISIIGNNTHFERIDSVNAVIHLINEFGADIVIDSLTASVGDTISALRLSNTGKVIFDDLQFDNSFGIFSKVQTYKRLNDAGSYYKIKDERGLIELREAPTDSTEGLLLKLKGVIVKFFVYGDTTLNIVSSFDQGKTVPWKFELYQNYPNPFNPTTTISYQLPETQNIKLTIYDLLGNTIAILVNKEQEPGYYQIDVDGKEIASGVYLYELKSENFYKTKKMLLIK